MQHHLVIGSGPVGSGIALRLAEQGMNVTVATRSGTGPDHAGITKVKCDATDAESLTTLAQGAASIFNCANPPYQRWDSDWPPMHQAIMTAAVRSGAVVVMMDNLYGFGEGRPMPMREGDALQANGPKGATRARMATELLSAHADGRLRATLARASDFYGPGVIDASLGQRAVPKVLAGKKVSLLGRIDIPHSVSYMPDVVTTMVAIALDERAWGKPWHVPSGPALSQRAVVTALAEAAGTTVKVTAMPKALLNIAGVFSPPIGALKEVWYQFDQPWVIDAAHTETTFGLAATPLAQGAADTVAWWRERLAS